MFGLIMLSDQDSLFNYRGWSSSPGDLAEVISQLFCFLASQGKDRKKIRRELWYSYGLYPKRQLRISTALNVPHDGSS